MTYDVLLVNGQTLATRVHEANIEYTQYGVWVRHTSGGKTLIPWHRVAEIRGKISS